MEGLHATLKMFVILGVELSALFILISYIVGLLQRVIPQEKMQQVLSSDKKSGYIVAAVLGMLTPFCSCSTIPMIKGLIKARSGFGPVMVFLFTSPLLNPVIIGLLWYTFGLGLTVIYFVVALVTSLFAGWLLDRFGFYQYVKSFAVEKSTRSGSSVANGCGASSIKSGDKLAQRSKFSGVWKETLIDFKSVLPYLLVGIALGSVIYGFVPTELLSQYAGGDNPLAIPVAAVIGIPLYIRAEAVIPLAGVLMAKGVSAGAVLALIIGSAGASLTEVIPIFKWQIIVAFLAVVFMMAVGAGYFAYFFL